MLVAHCCAAVLVRAYSACPFHIRLPPRATDTTPLAGLPAEILLYIYLRIAPYTPYAPLCCHAFTATPSQLRVTCARRTALVRGRNTIACYGFNSDLMPAFSALPQRRLRYACLLLSTLRPAMPYFASLSYLALAGTGFLARATTRAAHVAVPGCYCRLYHTSPARAALPSRADMPPCMACLSIRVGWRRYTASYNLSPAKRRRKRRRLTAAGDCLGGRHHRSSNASLYVFLRYMFLR